MWGNKRMVVGAEKRNNSDFRVWEVGLRIGPFPPLIILFKYNFFFVSFK